jgi:hypothetical protein
MSVTGRGRLQVMMGADKFIHHILHAAIRGFIHQSAGNASNTADSAKKTSLIAFKA